MPRRRIYILNVEDYLHDAEPAAAPSRVWPALRLVALAAAVVGNGIVLVRLIVALFPTEALELGVPAAVGYALIVLLFVALAKRLNHIE